MTEAADRRRVMRWMGTWIDKVGSASGWLSLAAILPPLVVLFIIWASGGAFPYEVFCGSARAFEHNPACVDAVNAWFVPLLIVLGLMFLAFWPLSITWLSVRLHVRRRHRLQDRFEPRLQTAKDWLMRGDVDRAQYERITTPVKRLTEGDAPSERLLLAGQILARLGALLLAVGITLAAMTLFYAPELNVEQESWWYFGILVPASTIGVVVGTLLLMAGLPLRVRGVRGTAGLVAEAEAAEEAALAQRRGAPTRPGRPQ